MKTWHFELLAVALVLGAVAAFGGGPAEWIGAGAVTLSFAHAQVADRLAEREAAREVVTVDCHRWATRYLVGKETLWCAFFVLHHAWSALAGVALFLVYPAWRRWWRARSPLDRARPRVHGRHPKWRRRNRWSWRRRVRRSVRAGMRP